MNTLREDLKNIFMINPVMNIFLTAGVGLIFIYPVLLFINTLDYWSAIYAITPIAYVFYIIGIVTCIANNYEWAIGSVLAIQALSRLIDLIRYFHVGTMLYFMIYLAASILIFLLFAKSKGVNFNINRNIGNMNVTPQSLYCPSCGAPIDADMKFCQSCGYALTNVVQARYVPGNVPGGSGNGNNGDVGYGGYSSNLNTVAQICSSVPALIFSIIFSVSILTKVLANHSFIGILSCIPMIIICIGCWLIYVGFNTGNVSTTGFSLISGCIIFEIVCSLVIPVILMIFTVILWIAIGSEASGTCMMYLIACAIYAALYFFFWKGLRDTVVSAKNIMLGQSVPWKVSLYSIVVICLGIVTKFISLILAIIIRGSLDYYINRFIGGIGIGGGFGGYGSIPMGNQISEAIYGVFNSFFSGLGIMNSIVLIAVSVCAVILLFQIRSRGKQDQYYNNAV